MIRYLASEFSRVLIIPQILRHSVLGKESLVKIIDLSNPNRTHFWFRLFIYITYLRYFPVSIVTSYLGYSLTHATICLTSLSITCCTPALTCPFINLKSEQWNPPGIICNGCCVVEGKGPPGLNSLDTPLVLHGSNCPFVQISLVVSSNFHPCVNLLT